MCYRLQQFPTGYVAFAAFCTRIVRQIVDMFRVNFGVRQGSVLSPLLFAWYLDNLAKSGDRARNVFIMLYVDDIILLAPSVPELDYLYKICERELKLLDMAIINVRKSSCIRIGHRMDAQCANISLCTNSAILCADEIKYLGICILRSHTFKCLLANNRRSFYRSANAIFGKIGRMASE